MARLFVAVWPPEEILERVAALPRPDVDGLRWTQRHQWHVTLRFLGRVDDVDDAVASLSGMGPVEPAEAGLGPEVGHFGRRVLHVPVSGLDRLAATVTAATAEVGKPPEDRPFAGHLTLARTSKSARVDLRLLAGGPIRGLWTVTELSLMESRVSGAGASYEEVRRFALTA